MIAQKLDLMQLMEQFGSEQACREVLAELRWPNGVLCSRCGGEKHAYDSDRFVWDCYSCGYQFSVMSGTIFHDTKLPLRKWLMAVLIMVEAKNGISANQMKRTIGVSYKTAWYLCHRIRAAMAEAVPELLTGTVEVDETWVGGRQRHVGRGNRDKKQMVVGAVERGGSVRLITGSHASRKVLHGFIHQNVSGEATAIYTDEWAAYNGIGDSNTVHDSVNHKAEEWVRGSVHTNSIEGTWSLFNRALVGSYHQVQRKHLNKYLNEMEWRQNNRENQHLFRDTLKALVSAEAMQYSELTGKV